jgi:1-acyl-sn-glycerol-3-phosphate acyltransferase
MLRNLIFNIFFFGGIFFISIIFLPSLILPQTIVIFGGKLMGWWAGFCLKTIMVTKIEIIGKENLTKNKKFFIAASHQSMFETFFLQTIFNSPVFILKKELLKIPIFGWYLRKIGSISIDRNKITKDNLGFSDQIKNHINNSNRPIIIFPQATRLEVSDRSPFKKGVKRIYEELNIFCQPIALNSGDIWPKNGELKTNKILTISVLDPITPGMNADQFLNILQKNIYQEIDRIS